MQTVKSVFGVTRALLPVLYCGGLAVYFLRVSGGSMEGINTIGLGPTILGLGAVGFLFCIPLIMKVMRIMPGPRPPISGGGPPKDDDDGFDPDAAIARYMASKRAAEAAPGTPAPRPAPKNSGYQSSGPAKPAGFGRRIS